MVGDIEISIPSDAAETPISFPPSYVTLYGEVEWSDYATGDILVFATTATYYGAVLDQMVLGSPGSFSLRVPPSTSSILVWAIADEDGDGSFDIGDDPSGAADLVSTNENDIYDVEVQITDSPPPATISGAVRWDGPVGPTDQVWIVLLADEDGEPNPVFFEGISAPVFPQPFSFDVPPGTWYPSCYLDIGGDNAGEPQPNEPTYTGSAITVVPGQSVPGVQLWLALDGEE